MTPEEQLIQRYFDAFTRHDIEGVMACFMKSRSLLARQASDPPVAQKCGVRTRLSSRCFLTGIAICASAPATAATESRSLSSLGREPSVEESRRSARK